MRWKRSATSSGGRRRSTSPPGERRRFPGSSPPLRATGSMSNWRNASWRGLSPYRPFVTTNTGSPRTGGRSTLPLSIRGLRPRFADPAGASRSAKKRGASPLPGFLARGFPGEEGLQVILRNVPFSCKFDPLDPSVPEISLYGNPAHPEEFHEVLHLIHFHPVDYLHPAFPSCCDGRHFLNGRMFTGPATPARVGIRDSLPPGSRHVVCESGVFRTHTCGIHGSPPGRDPPRPVSRFR